MADWYDILDVARKEGYAVRVPLVRDAEATFIPEHGEQPEHAQSYPMQGISLRADEVISALKQGRLHKAS